MPRLATLAGTVALFCISGPAANAQYQAVYGGGRDDAAQGGIIETGSGDFLSVGYSDSFGADRDIYVIMSDICGTVLWARTYDIGGNDEGKKVRETALGEFVIIGTTENLNNCCTRSDAFLMKIDPAGNVVWARTMGGIDDDQGADVKVRGTTFYFAGRTNSFGRGDYDGWLGAVDDNSGALLWSRVYGGEQADGFNGLDFSECDNGTIIAAGDTRSYTANGDLDIYAIRTDFNGVPVGGWPFHYGSGVDDLAWSVLGLNSDIYIAGYTDGVGNGREGYILHVDCDGNYLNDRAYGGGLGLDDELTEIQFDSFNGIFVLTGFMQDPPGGFGGYDVWMMRLNGNLSPSAPAFLYGDQQDEQGWSVAASHNFFAPGYYSMAGWTESYGVFGGRDLYQISTDQNGRSGCQESRPQVLRFQPGYGPQPSPTWWPQARVICDARVSDNLNNLWQWICTSCPLLRNAPDGRGLSLRDNHGADQARMITAPRTN
jgi:hypothetical protein